MEVVFKTATCTLNGRTISIKYGRNLLSKSCVRLFDDQGYTINNNGNSKELLRKINAHLNLNVQLSDGYGTYKNTHQLADHIIEAIKTKEKYY